MNALAPKHMSEAHDIQNNIQTHRRLKAILLVKNQCTVENQVDLRHENCFSKSLTACCDGIYYQRRICARRSIESVNFLGGTRKKQLIHRVSFWSWSANSNLRIDSMLTMALLIAAVVFVVISENTVVAAQRDSVKQKNTNKLNSNANAILMESESVSSVGNGNGNGNARSDSNTNINKYSNDISNGKPSNNVSSSNIGNSVAAISTGEDVTMMAITTTSTTIAMQTSSSSSPLYRGRLQKNSGAYPSGPSMIDRNAIDMGEDVRNGPYFDKAASKNITALLGKTAYLNCRVKNLGNKTMLLQVSWVRHRDIHLLTVGRYTYTSDQRFRAIHQPQTEDWILQIKYPQHRDSGIYECQVSSTPHMSHYIHLNVVEPSTEIIGAPDLYIESGSTINLTCVILNSPEPPAYIFWNHNNAIINYDSPRGGVSVVTNKGETTTSFLLIKSARPSDSGHYQCNPSNAKPKSVTVHVLNGEFPAAMQRSGPAHHRMSQTNYILVYLSMYLCTLVYAKLYMLPLVAIGTKTALN